MGARHALHFLDRTPRAELVAAFSPDPKEIAWARTRLEPFGVKLYTDYDEMLAHEGLEAVVIGTVTTMHAEHAIKAINKDLHVLCEKPLSTTVEIVSLDILSREGHHHSLSPWHSKSPRELRVVFLLSFASTMRNCH